MKNIKICITKAKVFETVSLNSAYTGAKQANDKAEYDKIATVAADEALLATFWREVTGEVAEKFREQITLCELTDESFEITLGLSESFDDTLAPSLTDDITAAVCSGVTARWFRFTDPQRAGEWGSNAEALLERALAKVWQRRKPKRRF